MCQKSRARSSIVSFTGSPTCLHIAIPDNGIPLDVLLAYILSLSAADVVHTCNIDGISLGV
jgi:hypothetical protein